MSLFLILVIVAIALGITGAVVHGLFYLLIIAVALFVVDLAGFGARWSRGSGRHRVR